MQGANSKTIEWLSLFIVKSEIVMVNTCIWNRKSSMCVYVINIYHICKLSRTVFYFEKTLLYEIAIIRTKITLLCYRFHDTVVELEISVITFELVHAIHDLKMLQSRIVHCI